MNARLKLKMTEVLVVGAGPAGLTTAITLARSGLSCVVVERRKDASPLPRATVESLRTMELLRSWGLGEAMRAGGVEVEWRMMVCETLANARAGTVVPVGYPTPAQSALISPTEPACVPQDHLEAVLMDHLRSFDTAHVIRGTEIIGLDNGPDGIRAALRDTATGRTQVVDARYLVAADGAHSAVRAALGIVMRGPENLLRGSTAVFHAPLSSVVGEHVYGIYAVTDPDGEGILLPAGRDDRWLYGWDPGMRSGADFTEDELATRIRGAVGVADLAVQIERVGDFTFDAQLADTFRSDSVFLAGDAAHRVTPRGGTGMNIAIHGGFDLGWKLAWVLRGWSGDELLETYESDRRPAVEHNLARSIDADGSRRDPGEEVAVDLGGRIPHVWMRSELGRVSTLDLLGPGLTLFTGPDNEVWETAATVLRNSPPIDVRRLDTMSARAMGIREGAALLARPDGVPIGSSTARTGSAAIAAIASALAGMSRRPNRSSPMAVHRRVNSTNIPRTASRITPMPTPTPTLGYENDNC